MLRSGFYSAPLRFGMSATWRMLGVLDQSEKLHQHAMSGRRHWSLYTIGVVPERQGKGVGTALIQPVLAYADQDKLPCYLDTDNEKSVKFFENNGWKVHIDVKEPAYGPRFWTMIREPKLPSSQ